MVSALVVLMSTVVLEKALGRRGITITYSGKVWADEFGTFINCADAYLCGLGKSRLSKSEQQYYVHLLNELGTKAQRKAKKLGAKADVDYERMLYVLVDIKERMARIKKQKIDRAKVVVAKLIEATGLEYAYYILKVWATPSNKRTSKQWKSWKHDNNQALIQALNWAKENPKTQADTKIRGLAKWLVYELLLWNAYNKLKDESDKLAAQYKLWPAYFRLEKLSFHTHGFDTRAAVRDEELEYNEQPSGLTGEWTVDTIGDMADNHVTEFAALERALKGCEYYLRKRSLKCDTRPAYTKKQVNGKWVLQYRHTKATDQLLDQAKARRLERQRQAWLKDAGKLVVKPATTWTDKPEAIEAPVVESTFKDVGTFKNEDEELRYMEQLYNDSFLDRQVSDKAWQVLVDSDLDHRNW